MVTNCGVKGAIWYRWVWLTPNSEAYRLHEAGQTKALEAHLKGLK